MKTVVAGSPFAFTQPEVSIGVAVDAVVGWGVELEAVCLDGPEQAGTAMAENKRRDAAILMGVLLSSVHDNRTRCMLR